jgi:hypothetical protein
MWARIKIRRSSRSRTAPRSLRNLILAARGPSPRGTARVRRVPSGDGAGPTARCCGRREPDAARAAMARHLEHARSLWRGIGSFALK